MDKKALFFSKIEKLDDKFEGAPSRVRMQSSVKREAFLKKIFTKEQIEFMKKQNREFDKALLRKWTVVNCWSISDYESAAMWKIYLKSNAGVAIQSSFKSLTKSFDVCKDHEIWIGKVKYIDYDKDLIPFHNIFFRITSKRKSFEHEKELRAAVVKIPDPIVFPWQDNDPFPKGLYVSVNLDVLIEQVIISPTAEEWFIDLVKSLMTKYNLNKKVVTSSLTDDPFSETLS